MSDLMACSGGKGDDEMNRSSAGIDWSCSLVMVLSPDSFIRGLGARILTEVLDAGYRDIASRVIRPGALLIDAIREDLAQKDIYFGTYRYRELDTVFNLGPSLAVALTGPSDIHERIHTIKGSGSLESAPAHTIRRRYRAINTLLGLMHASDSPQEAELDWRTFFVRDWWNVGLDDMPATAAEMAAPGARALAALLDRPPDAVETRGFIGVREQFRRTLIAHLCDLLPVPVAESVAIFAEADEPLPEELIGSVAASLEGKTDLLIRRGLTATFTPGGEHLDATRLWRVLAGYGVVVDPWARAVLSTSRYFAPLRYDGAPVAGPGMAEAGDRA